jgi:hypothetical protein
MLLQCGIMDGGAGDEPRPEVAWLGATTLESLTELNETALALLAEQAAAPGVPGPLLREIAAAWGGLDAAARRRAAACPYLLLDAGFAERERWRAAAAGDAGGHAGAAFFSVPGMVEVARLTLTFAWHLTRAQPVAARVLLGIPPACVTLIAALTLRQIHALAERHPHWLRPRWPSQREWWRALLAAAAAGEPRALERARLHGLTLLAAEVRALPGAQPATLPPYAPRAAAPVSCVISPAGTASTAPSPRSPARP